MVDVLVERETEVQIFKDYSNTDPAVPADLLPALCPTSFFFAKLEQVKEIYLLNHNFFSFYWRERNMQVFFSLQCST